MIGDPSDPLSGGLFVPVVIAIGLVALATILSSITGHFSERTAASLEKSITVVIGVGGAYTLVLLVVVVVTRFSEFFVGLRVMLILFVLILLPVAALVGIHRLFTRGRDPARLDSESAP